MDRTGQTAEIYRSVVMNFQSGFAWFVILVLVVAACAVTLETLRPAPSAGKWHKPLGWSICGLLVACAIGIGWYALSGGVA